MLKNITICLTLVVYCFISASSLSAKETVTVLYQTDFDHGTVLIDQPGKYILGENISFNPNSTAHLGVDAYNAGFPLASQYKSAGGAYDDRAFGIGFFAAISIQAHDVELDLNGFTIEQSEEHALLMRFFAVIELNDQPFVPSQGPFDFGSKLISSERVVIKNGTIGRSAHHGIHGNSNKDIKIHHIDFVDYEVAAVALNNVEGLKINHCTAQNRQDVPVIGIFSSAQFLKPYLDWLAASGTTTTLTVQGVPLTAAQIRDALKASIINVHQDLIVDGKSQIDKELHPSEYTLFHNKFGILDGNSYGFLVNNFGFAVHGFPSRDNKPSQNIHIDDVHILLQRAFINEVIALRVENAAVTDAVGAVFQIKNLHPDTNDPITVSDSDDTNAVYLGNIVANAQALCAKAKLAGDFDGSHLDVSRLNINQDILSWIEEMRPLSSLVPDPELGYYCNGDAMFHVCKGVIGFKMDGAKNVHLNNTSVENIENLGKQGSNLCGNYVKSHPKATLKGYGGAITRGYSFAGSQNVHVKNSRVINLKAAEGPAIGFDIFTDTKNLRISRSAVHELSAGNEDYAPNDGPTELPSAIGFRIGENVEDVVLKYIYATDLNAYAETKFVDDLSGQAEITDHYE